MPYRERKKRDSPERFQKDHRPARSLARSCRHVSSSSSCAVEPQKWTICSKMGSGPPNSTPPIVHLSFYRSHRPLSTLTSTISSGLPKSCLPLNWKGELVPELAAASWRRNYNLNTRYTPRAQMETKSGSPYPLTTFDDGFGCIKTPRFVSC